MELFPAIDLRNGQVVRLMQGEYDQQTTYGDSPLDQAKLFEDAGAKWLHVVDLDGARSGDLTHLPIIREICEKTNLKVEVGGGVRDENMIRQLLDVGVERAIMGTAAFEDWPWFESLMEHEDLHHRIVLGLDARKGLVALSGWETQTEFTAIDIAKQVSDWPLGAIVYTDIATDGTMQGPNFLATQEIAEATKVPVVASGGVGALEHLEALQTLPLQGVIVGRALYENAFTVEAAIEALAD